MSEQSRGSHPKQRLFSRDVEGFDSLAELALDMRVRRGIMLPTRCGGSWILRCGSLRITLEWCGRRCRGRNS